MAIADTTLQAIKGQAYRLHGSIVDITSGNPIEGLTGLAATICADDTTFASTTNTPTEIGTTGVFYLDLTAEEMTSNVVLVKVTATNANAKYQVVEIPTADLSEVTGRADEQGVKRFEQYIAQLLRLFMNREVFDRTAGTMCLYNDADNAVSLTAPMTETSTSITRGQRA